MEIYRYLLRYPKLIRQTRFYSSMTEKRGLVLGVYSSKSDNQLKFTPYAQRYNDATGGDLMSKICTAGPIKSGEYKVFWGIGEYPAVAVAGLGDASSWSPLEGMNGAKENVRIAAGVGAKALLKQKITNIEVEDLGDAENAAVGAILSTFKYQQFKSKEKQSPKANIKLANGANDPDAWHSGVAIAESQNFTRCLMDCPANVMTPQTFAKVVSDELTSLGVKCIAHDQKWAEDLKMNSFLSVSKGSDEPPVFLELTYTGSETSPLVCLVGKGITFDSGGICIKPSANMDLMRADMGGAACIAGTIRALAKLKAPVNVIGLLPLSENMPNGSANKPGDIVTAMNGKSISVLNTDAEGRLVLADALCYSEKFKPKCVVDIATLTGAMQVALGDCVAGVFTNNDDVWQKLNTAGSETGDRVWRMPLYKHYTTLVTEYDSFDVSNLGKGKGGGACTAAAFLREFVPKDTPWAHIDMAGVMANCLDQVYTGSKGIPGRPMRTLIEFVLSYSC